MNTDRSSRHFQEELDEVKHRLLEMGGLAEQRLMLAVAGLVERSASRLDDVLTGDGPVNELHLEVDDRCFKLLALRQPMAIDLRAIVAAVKINGELERVGDLAVNIAQAMLRDALDAYVRSDVTLAKTVCDRDDELDELKSQVFRELLDCMLAERGTIEPSLDLLLISRHLERVGDHATNIAEDVIFLVSAKDIRHHAAE